MIPRALRLASVVAIHLLLVLGRADPTPATPGRVYQMAPNSTDGLIYTSPTNQTVLLTIVVPTSMANYNSLSSILISINSQRVTLQPGHNYFTYLTNATSVSPPVISDPTFAVQFTTFPLLFLFSVPAANATNANAPAPLAYPLFLGYNLLLSNMNTTNITFVLMTNSSQFGSRCLLFFQDLMPETPAGLPQYSLTSVFLSQIANTSVSQSMPFFRAYGNSYLFVQPSASLNATVAVAATTPGQSILFYSFCLDAAKARTFQNDFVRAISRNQEGFFQLGEFQNTGSLTLKYLQTRRDSLTVQYYPNVVFFPNSGVGSFPGVTKQSIPFTYNSIFYREKLTKQANSSTVFTPINLNQATAIGLSTNVNYLVNYRAGISLSGSFGVGTIPGGLDYFSVDLGYRVINLGTNPSDGSKRSWLLTGIFMIITGLFVWGSFVYFYFLGRFLDGERARRQSYDKYFKKVSEESPAKEKDGPETLPYDKAFGVIDIPLQDEYYLNTQNDEKNDPKVNLKLNINVFKEGIETPKGQSPDNTQLQSPRFNFPVDTMDSHEADRNPARTRKATALSLRESNRSGRPPERLDTQPKEMGLLPENANDLTFKRSVSEASINEN